MNRFWLFLGRKLSCLRVRRLDTLISPLSDNNNGDQEREARGERGFGPKRCFAAATLASTYLVGFGPDGLEGREGGEALCSRRRRGKDRSAEEAGKWSQIWQAMLRRKRRVSDSRDCGALHLKCQNFLLIILWYFPPRHLGFKLG